MSRLVCIAVFVFCLVPVASENWAADIYRGSSRSNTLQTAATDPKQDTKQNAQTEADKRELEEQQKLEEEEKEKEKRTKLEQLWEDRRRRYLFPYRYPTLNRFSNGQSTYGQRVLNQTSVSPFRYERMQTFSSFNQNRFNQSARQRGYNQSRHNQSPHNIGSYNQRRFVAFPIDPLYPY